MEHFQKIIPLLIYLGVMLTIASWANRKKQTSDSGFINEYFLGGRSLGGFVLAMTIISTYVGASSFLAGPGVAYEKGLGWVLLAVIQVPTAFLTLGILGKKLAIISRKIKGVTIIDLLKARYQSDGVVIIASLVTLLFFGVYILVQFKAGAILFETLTGLSYHKSLTIFAGVVIIYTTIGGFRAVALTDAIQGTIMMFVTIFLLIKVISLGGGLESIFNDIATIDPKLLSPTQGGDLPKSFVLSFWILVGVAILGLPQTIGRCMAFKDSKSMHRAMFVGTFVVGFLMFGLHLLGVLAIPIVPNLEKADSVIPYLMLNDVYPFLGGLLIAGPLAAIMSTVDSLLISSSATIIKDLYLNYFSKDVQISERKVRLFTLISSLTIGITIYLIAYFAKENSELLVWLNLSALGGLEAAFFLPIIFGLYWPRANSAGALASMIFGVSTYLLLSYLSPNLSGVHIIIPTLLLNLLVFMVFTLLSPPPEKYIKELFFSK